MLQRHASYAMPIARPENSNSSSSHRCYSCSSSCSSACFSCSSSVCIVLFRTTAILRCAGPVWGGCWRAPCAHALASLSLRSFPRSSSLIISSSMTIYMCPPLLTSILFYLCICSLHACLCSTTTSGGSSAAADDTLQRNMLRVCLFSLRHTPSMETEDTFGMDGR